jgi:hypothetical protein
MMKYAHRLPVFLIASLVAALLAPAGLAFAQVERPLVQDGKQALYQRVIAVPGAALFDEIGRRDSARTIPPFSTYYVYERRESGDQAWLRVGDDSNGTISGWLRAVDSVDWNQTLTVAFRDPAEQNRVLLFDERETLKTIVENGDAERYRSLREQAIAGVSADSPVVAIQPDQYVDIRRDFYLMPILEHEDVLVDGRESRLLRVATIPLQDSEAITSAYRTGIVFVIDTTVSMQPYIDVMQSVMQGVYESIEQADLGDHVNYGLVAFRDSVSEVPGLEYVSQTYAGLGDGPERFLSRIESVRAADVSSQGFNEDAYAGINEAIRGLAWNDYYARYVVLITDAGPRDGSDPLSSTGLGADSLRRLASDRDIALGVFHLRTPAGEENHDYAEEQYRRLSSLDDIGDFYYPVATGEVDRFEAALTTLTDQLTAQVRAAASGRPPQLAAGRAADSELEALQQKIDRLGYGLRMRYLREQSGTGVPSLFNAWMIDRDFDSPDDRALDVRVLLTRDQLSDLHDVLRQVLIRAEEGALAPETFLDELKSLAASVSRDPEATTTATRAVGGQSLADLGYMREYLEGLPYKSDVMYIDLSVWDEWPAQRQFEFINQLDGKVAYYRALHDNVDLWVSLDGEAIDGDSVYPLLLDALP